MTWGYSVALLNVTIMLHLKTMLPDCNIYLTSKHPHRHLEVGKWSTGAWGGGGSWPPHILSGP